MSKDTLLADLAYVRQALNELHTTAEGRTLDDDEQARWDEGTQFLREGKQQLERYAELDRHADIPDHVERTQDAPSFNVRVDPGDDIYDLSTVRAMQGSEEFRTQLEDRAMRSIEKWDKSFTAEMRESAENVARHLDKQAYPGQGAAHILRAANPHYLSAFKKIVANPQSAQLGLTEHERLAVAEVTTRAMNEGTTTAGGFTVPPMLDPTIILTNAGISNPFRTLSTVKTIGTQTWKGVTSAGVTAEWTAEATEVADASPTVSQPTITPIRADAYIQASIELLEDTNISAEVSMLIADARDRLEGTAFAVGTGSTQPTGIVTALQAVTASRVNSTTNGSFGAVDVFAVDNALPQRWRAGASWVANKSIYNLVRQMAVGGANSNPGAFWTDFGAGRPPGLIGYGAYESSAMFNAPLDAATASNDDCLVLGDFSQYYIVDRIGLELVYNPLVLGSNRRPTGEVGWVAFWRVGANTVNADAFRMLRV